MVTTGLPLLWFRENSATSTFTLHTIPALSLWCRNLGKLIGLERVVVSNKGSSSDSKQKWPLSTRELLLQAHLFVCESGGTRVSPVPKGAKGTSNGNGKEPSHSAMEASGVRIQIDTYPLQHMLLWLTNSLGPIFTVRKKKET